MFDSRKDNSRAGMVQALKELLTPAQLEAGDQFIKQRVQGYKTRKPATEPAVKTKVKWVTKCLIYKEEMHENASKTLKKKRKLKI